MNATILMDAIGAVAAAVAAIAAVVGLRFIYLQLKQQNLQLKQQVEQSRLEALTRIHSEVATPKFRDALGKIFAADEAEVAEPPSKELLDSIRTVAGVYDLLGAGVEEGVFPKDATLKTEWKILVLLWSRLEPFIRKERIRRGLPYKEHFEFLAKEAETYRQSYLKDHELGGDPKIYLRDYEREPRRFAPDGSPLPRLVYQGKHLHFYGGDGCWEYVTRPQGTEGVTIVAVTDQKQMLFVEQYRVPIGKPVIELPAGLRELQKGRLEEVEAAARRELSEETGFECNTISRICYGPLLPGITNEINTFCLAEGAKPLYAQKHAQQDADVLVIGMDRGNKVEGEKITVYAVRMERVMSWLQEQAAAGKAIDLRVYAGLLWAADST